jgi:two-component system chemotaxis response regulator CheY
MKVLVVDDSQIMRRIIVGALEKAGIKDVLEAADGEQAVASVAKNADVKLILMDWNMPNMTGIEALGKIRAAGSVVPIIMVTTESEKERVLEAIKAGANDYLAKPFDPKAIQGKLEKFLGLKA